MPSHEQCFVLSSRSTWAPTQRQITSNHACDAKLAPASFQEEQHVLEPGGIGSSWNEAVVRLSGQFPATVQHVDVCVLSDDLDWKQASLKMDGSCRHGALWWLRRDHRFRMHGTLALGHAAQGVFNGTTGTPRIAAAYPLPFGRIEALLMLCKTI
jgi:hypothetical protein